MKEISSLIFILDNSLLKYTNTANIFVDFGSLNFPEVISAFHVIFVESSMFSIYKIIVLKWKFSFKTIINVIKEIRSVAHTPEDTISYISKLS